MGYYDKFIYDENRSFYQAMTFTGFIGAVCMFPLRAIINTCVALGIHPNTLTLIGVLIVVAAAFALGLDHFLLAFVIMLVGSVFDFIDGKVAYITNTMSRFGAFWDSTLDRFADIALFLGLIYLYADLHRTDYVLITALALTFSIMTSYARARAESLIEKCKVGFMERPERIVLFWIGTLTDRMAAVMWVILIFAILAVANRIHYTYLVLNNKPIPSGSNALTRILWRGFFWRDERATLPYDVLVIAILAFIWLTPPDWLRDPTASGLGVWEYLR